ncbi:MAG: flagellar hook-length control protein FliK [Gammaproteobacteria bacterium]|nr:flagellar hook-length control protein FliK [Gammaproteobacteria bacterium]
MVNQKLNTATIRMDPPMLGRLEVHIQLVDDMTNVTINTQHAQTRDLIDSASVKLREYLQENGYQNVNVDVSHQEQQQASDQSGDKDDLPVDENPSVHVSDNLQDAQGNRYFSSDSVVDYFA